MANWSLGRAHPRPRRYYGQITIGAEILVSRSDSPNFFFYLANQTLETHVRHGGNPPAEITVTEALVASDDQMSDDLS